jgi:predicted DNA-binding ArsR family transcriptional regulator
MHIIHISVLVNSLSVLILYVLVYILFYHNDVKRFNDDILNKKLNENTTSMENLIRDVNYNNEYIKGYINIKNNMNFE